MFSRKSADFPDRAGLLLLLGETKRVYSGAVSPPRLASLRSSAASVCAASAPHRHTERHAGDVTLWQGRCGAASSSVCLRHDWLSKWWGGVARNKTNPLLCCPLSLCLLSVHEIENTVFSCTFSSTYLSRHCCSCNGKTGSPTLLTSVIFVSINFKATHKPAFFCYQSCVFI